MKCLLSQADTGFRNRLNRFLNTPYYIICMMLAGLLGNLLSLELVTFTVYVAVGVYVCVATDDLLPMTPLFLYCYITPSRQNNPGLSATSSFASGLGGIWLASISGLLVLAMVYFVIRHRKRYFVRKQALLLGMLILSGAYMLSGIGSTAYPDSLGQNLLFSFMQAVALTAPYFLLRGGIRWGTVRGDYLAWIGMCSGFMLLSQILQCYLFSHVVVDGVIHRTLIYSGWGMYNNIGTMLAIAIPFPFYLSTRHRKGWIGILIASVFLFGIVMTCSRNSLIFGVAVFLICTVLTLLYSHNRKYNLITLTAVFGTTTVLLVIFHRQILNLFSELISMGLDPSSRDDIYVEGLKLFSKWPVFGASFFSPEFLPWDFSRLESFSGFIPPRWHNTFVQLLASCGLVGMGAYLFHRFQTIRLFLKCRSMEQIFITVSLITLLLSSLLDCHFFNLGPCLYYSAALAFVEMLPASKKCSHCRHI